MMNNLINYWMVRMDDVATYLLSATLVLTLLYAPYTLLLRKERFFRQNRFTLLAIMVLSLVLPFCDFHALYPGELLPSLPSLPTAQVVEEDLSTPISVTATMEPMVITEVIDEPFRLLPWLCHLYIIGALIMLAIRLWQFARMHHLIRRGCLWSDVEDGITIHCHADDVAPCSWMRHIVISEHDYRHHRHEILLHERGHVLYHHSWDILLLMLVQTIQWYNPFAYMLGASLRDVHEYEADDYVLRQGVTISEYQTLLLKTAVGVGKYTFANNFNHCFIKNRIVMMKNQSPCLWKRYKALYILPLVFVLLSAFATPEVSNPISEDGISSVDARKKVKVSGKIVDAKSGKPLSGVNVCVMKSGNPRILGGVVSEKGKFSLDTYEGNVLMFSFVGMQDFSVIVPEGGAKSMTIALSEAVLVFPEMSVVGYAPQEETDAAADEAPKEVMSNTGKEESFFVVERMPEYPGGMRECYRFFSQNIKYPTAASKAGIQGKVIVEFLVEKDGSIADITVKQGVNPELDAEAVRVVGLMPKWKPGEQRGEPVSVRYTMPIAFSLKK